MNELLEFSKILSEIPNISHAFFNSKHNCSTRVNDKLSNVLQNRLLAMDSLELSEYQFVMANIAHSNLVSEVSQENICQIKRLDQDALVTKSTNIALAVTYADCVPILLAGNDGSYVSAIHAGWRGLANGVVVNTINELKKSINVDSLCAAIGPCISQQGYEVGGDVVKFFSPWPDCIMTEQNKYYIDLTKIVFAQLKFCGVRKIEKVGDYTDSQSGQFFSHRKQGEQAGRHMALIVKNT